ncbi:MAG TPA: hypothetical protein VMD92_06215 [Acidobacteriaceae bacterium]|jgi:hypothetical protein|nr:hypothetical protein [Acidobacteriaceae bacterium]
MEADWSVEVGPQLDEIDADWPGLVDLRATPGAVEGIAEAARYQPLRDALVALNAAESPLHTAKCDVWGLAENEIDAGEFNAAAGAAQAGMACYIDVLAREPGLYASFARHEAWARAVVVRLREYAIPQGRVDLVVRGARSGGAAGFGITLYAAGCGRDSAAAHEAWEAVLRAAVTATINEAEILPLR